MKNKIIIINWLLLIIILSFPAWSKPLIDLKISSQGYTFDYQLPQWYFHEVDTMGKPVTDDYRDNTFLLVSVPEFGKTNDTGKARLPSLSFHMAIPGTDNIPTFEITNIVKKRITLKHKIFPAQIPWPKSRPISERPFVMKKEYYESTGKKDMTVIASEPFEMRGVNCITVKIVPFIYNPLENRLTAIKKFTLKINTQIKTKYSQLKSKEYIKLLRNQLTNFDFAVEPIRYDRAPVERYLIITDPGFETTLADFITFRQTRFFVDLYNTNTTGTTASSIQTFISNRYNNEDTRPAFLLLVGDVDHIPRSTTSNTPTDLYYATMGGSGDYVPDIFMGRFSISDTTDLRNIMNKTMYMENNLANITKVNSFIASNDAGYWDVAEATHNYVIDNCFEPAGYDNKKRYLKQGATKAQVNSDINGGLHFLMYSGHGSNTSWADFSYTQTDVRALTNTVYPFTYSFACFTGNYPTAECFAETWIRDDHGAVSFWGSSVSSYWGPDDDVERNMADAMVDDGVTLVSASFIQGLLSIVNSYFLPGYFEQYNLFGDPALETFPNTPPILTIIQPPSGDTIVKKGNDYTIQWSDSDPDDNAAISLAYDIDNDYSNGNHTWITQSATEDPDGTGDQYPWNTTDVPEGTYYIWGTIFDGFNVKTYSISEGTVTIMQTPAVPAITLVGNPTTTSLEVTFSDVDNEQGYRIYKAISADGQYTLDHDSAVSVSQDYYTKTVTGLEPGIYYFFKVSAYNQAGESQKSDCDSNRTLFIYTLTATAGSNGSIDPDGDVSVIEGSDQEFLITPLLHYKVQKVLIDGDSVSSGNSYTFTNVTSDHTISVEFTQITHTITASAGSNGAIAPSGEITVNDGNDQDFSITPDPHYRIHKVLVDGDSIGAETSYTFINVTSGHTISVEFTPITHTITATAGANGAITPSGTIEVTDGNDQIFSITPDPHFKVLKVVIDDDSVSADTAYVFINVISNHTISVEFTQITHTITASAGSNGTITPSGEVVVNDGDNPAFTITPDSNYKIFDVQVDGASVGAVASHTFTNVASAHTISATFDMATPISQQGTQDNTARRSSFTVTPNPASIQSDFVCFHFRTPKDAKASLRIYDPLGNLVYKKEYFLKPGVEQKSWNLTNSYRRKIAGGTYIVFVKIAYIDNGVIEVHKTYFGVSVP